MIGGVYSLSGLSIRVDGKMGVARRGCVLYRVEGEDKDSGYRHSVDHTLNAGFVIFEFCICTVGCDGLYR